MNRSNLEIMYFV